MLRTYGSLLLPSFLYRGGRDVTGDASLLLLAIKFSVHRCVTERYHSLSHRLQQHPTLHSLVPAVCLCVFLRRTRVVLGGFIRAPLSGTAPREVSKAVRHRASTPFTAPSMCVSLICAQRRQHSNLQLVSFTVFKHVFMHRLYYWLPVLHQTGN